MQDVYANGCTVNGTVQGRLKKNVLFLILCVAEYCGESGKIGFFFFRRVAAAQRAGEHQF